MGRKKTEKMYEIIHDENQYVVQIKGGCIVKFPKTEDGKRLLIVTLRSFYNANNEHFFTFDQISDIIEYKDRRNVENYYREFKQVNGDYVKYLSRYEHLQESVELIEKIVIENPYLNINELFAYFTRQYPSKEMCRTSFNKYLSKIDTCNVLQSFHKRLNKNDHSWEQVELFNYLLEKHKHPIVKKKISESIQIKTNIPVKTEREFSLSKENLSYLVMFLYGSGLTYELIALLLGVSEKYVSDLVYHKPDLEQFILSSIDKWSGKICVDEKFIPYKGSFQFVFSAVDAVTDVPLFVKRFSTRTAESWSVFFTLFKEHYGTPKLIVFDGCLAIAKGKESVFPKVRYQFCKFHKMRNLIGKMYEHERNPQILEKMINKLKQVFDRESTRGRKSALRDLEKMLPINTKTYFDAQIKSKWNHLKHSLTTNAAERWNRKIKKIVSGKYGLKRPETISQLVYCLWFKELIMHNKNILNPKSIMTSLNITQLCQANLDYFGLNHKFSCKVA